MLTCNAGMTRMREGLSSTTRKLPPKLRLLTLNALDQRTSAARLARDLVSAITSDLGGQGAVTAAQRQLIQRAAILGAVCEDLETRWIAGDPLPAQEYLAGINTQRRCLMALGLERRARDVTLTLDQYLRSRANDDGLETGFSG